MSAAFALKPDGGRALAAPAPLRDEAASLWSAVECVVFDVDGTLYRQGLLRRRMMRELVGDALATRSTRTLRILSRYRRLREEAAEAEATDFEDAVRRRVGQATGIGAAEVARTIEEWMHRRPLRHLPPCAVPGVAEAFAAIRRSGRRIGVLSDYPAEAKLAALGLRADVVVDAGTADVGRLKPHPAGLLHVMRLADVRPEATLMVGDRAERDGEAARRAGVACLLRSGTPQAGYRTFADYRSSPFAAVPRLAGVPA